LGGILTALHEDPHAAWLILSCDLPLLRAEDVQQLLAHRDIFQIATCFTGTDELPEPLCAIYEPKARPRLLSFLALGAQCPRWILRNGGAKLLTPTYARAVFNANTPEEYDEALALLKEN
jgi:molybdopterin-guanine dinucleotide biosynthesis protein A